ncbi:hypothetical protein [Bradyrhizobium sp. CCBAU 51753]|uniref:hypothetical protein n=1 Tax=Bradyrhizobium sp. CCBAU 51753 TaxID=1325100 RepID=UPI00188A85F2|nr:hypothetical protein [Bradyrhizobium sp. CCBAU 51753]
MSIFASKSGLAMLLAALCLGGQQAHAQADPVRYWTPGSLFGFGGSLADAQKADTYGNFPSFGDSSAQGGNAWLNANRPDGWFMGSEGGRFGWNGFGRSGAFGSYEYQGAQVGYNFKSGDGSSPVTFFAGFDSLKYNPPGAGGPLAPFSGSSSANAGYAVRGGVEFRPTSNLSLSIGASFAQPQAERMDSDINSQLLPGQSPLFFGR